MMKERWANANLLNRNSGEFWFGCRKGCSVGSKGDGASQPKSQAAPDDGTPLINYMADQHALEGSGPSNVSLESSGSTVELNIKTLDSQIYSFHVDKNMPISMFKEKIASEIGVPVGQHA